ncbi:MAG: DinB family protein [Candidatus Adiutrix sp.]|jgi:uncharacterized damage-inducible protein DinB|nr:DinB family protein [Candidatus Adiutrix sp.]
MPQVIVNALKPPVDNAFGLLLKFIEVCPDEIWAEKSGGWPVWQQIYHAITAVDLFVEAPGTAAAELLAEPAVAQLAAAAERTVPRDKVKAACVRAKALADKYLSALADEALPQRNETPFKKINFELTHAATVALLASHTLYHLGAGDAALRNHNLKGVF